MNASDPYQRRTGVLATEDGQETLYDYYSDADSSSSDTDPTVPGAVGMPPEAGFQPSQLSQLSADGAVIAGVRTSTLMLGMTSPRKPSLLGRGAVLVGIVVATVIVCHWAFGQRGALPVAAPVSVPLPPPPPSPPPVAVAPMPSPEPAPAPVAAPPPSEPVAEPTADTGSSHRHRPGGSRHRSRHRDAGPWSFPGDRSAAQDGVPRGRSLRLRPIDVADPFAP